MNRSERRRQAAAQARTVPELPVAEERRVQLYGRAFLLRCLIAGPEVQERIRRHPAAASGHLDRQLPRREGDPPVFNVVVRPENDGTFTPILEVLQCAADDPAEWEDPLVKRRMVREALAIIRREDARRPTS